MIEIFWGCLAGGILFALITLIGGHGFDLDADVDASIPSPHFDWANPLTIVSAITAFGGIGILLAKYTSLDTLPLVSVAVTIALAIATALHFLILRPMRRGESSIAFSMRELTGHPGRVTIPLPANGYGEVMVKIGAANSCHIAVSFDGIDIPAGTEVVIVEVENGIVYVSTFDNE